MLKKQYICDICERERPFSAIRGVFFKNYPYGDCPPDFEIREPNSTDGTHLCTDCIDLIKKQGG